MTKLSENFSLAELTRSRTAFRNGIANQPNEEQLEALQALVDNVLQPLRDHYGPVVVTSGFRSKKLNRLIGGAVQSQHSKGEAADFTVVGESNKEVCEYIRNNLEFDQLIYEFGEGGWIHCSYRPKPRKQVLRAVRSKGRTVYLPGLS